MRKRQNNFLFLIGFLIVGNILAWQATFYWTLPRQLEVVFFDIGEGDSIFIETPYHHQILIDGGPDSAVLEKLGREMPFWDRTLDLVILTHPEKDHLGGLIEVLKSYKIKNILWTGVVADSLQYKEWLRRLELEKAQIKITKAGQKIKAGPISMGILHPFDNLENQKIKNLNNTSIIARLIFQDNSFLFTADIFQDKEREIITQEIPLNSNLLKVAHHGSKTSTSQEFLEAVSPEIAVISVGKNNYGHPHQEVLERLTAENISLLRTDRNGDIKIISDGNNLKIKTQK